MAESELQSGVVSVITGKVDSKTEASLARTYFLQYTQLLRHQKMMQEYLRTGSYHAAMMENFVDFVGKVVVDVGVGSGILSLFAAQAGAKHVYVVEASEMSEYARKLIAGNPSLSDRITVVKGKVEEVELPEKADILVSEPMGTLLVHEMMLKSYVLARDRFLVPSGKMFPKVGRIYMAPFSDETLFDEIANQALFWRQENYFGVDLTPLYESVYQSYFSQPVLDTFDPKILVAPAICHVLDLTSIKEEQLYDIEIPLKFTAKVDTKVHGLACWFDLLFDESSVPKLLITTTSYPTIYWFQLRCFLAKPLYVMAGQEITGHLHMIAHDNKSYTLYLELSAEMCGAGAEPRGFRQTSYGRIELKDLCYRTSQPYVQTQSNAAAQDQLPQQLIESKCKKKDEELLSLTLLSKEKEYQRNQVLRRQRRMRIHPKTWLLSQSINRLREQVALICTPEGTYVLSS